MKRKKTYGFLLVLFALFSLLLMPASAAESPEEPQQPTLDFVIVIEPALPNAEASGGVRLLSTYSSSENLPASGGVRLLSAYSYAFTPSENLPASGGNSLSILLPGILFLLCGIFCFPFKF